MSGGPRAPFAAVAALALFIGPVSARGQSLLIENARIWTNDPARPEATSLLVVDGRIAAIGTTAGHIDPTVEVQRIDLGGRRVVPGFNDAHTHFFEGAFALLAPDLLSSDTPEELVRRLGAHVADQPPGRWIVLPASWDHERWPGSALPSRALIDSVTPQNPIWMVRPDGHIGLANSLALEAGGVTRDTPDPPGGQIDRDPVTGEPTGILRDSSGLVTHAIPAPSEAEYRQALDAGLAHAARLGVTTLQDMCYDPGPVEVRLLEEYERTGKLTARFTCQGWLGDWEAVAGRGVRTGGGDEWVRVGGLKSFADGGLGASTAYFFEPYEGEAEYRGYLDPSMMPPDTFRERAAGADRAGLQLVTHAIGDAAISMVLDEYERIGAENPARDRRWRIEHAQHMARKDFLRMADLGAIASVQPFHAIDDGRWAERKIGPERAKTTYAFRSFLDADVPLAFGTDWPVAPLEPMRSIYAAVTRRTLDGAHPEGWVPEEKITLDEAFAAYTSGSSFADGTETWKGRLAPGYAADLVALSADPWSIRPEELADVEAVLTMVGGKIIYRAE
ncbi:MAG TPA: amidohydrolase [Gemmatimonadota bacterium]|nr:amidohydrolase [Gemmatimonadota bacterium]